MTASITPTQTPTSTVTPSVTASETPTQTPTISLTPSVTASETPTQTPTSTVTPSVTASETPTQTPTNTVTPSVTASITPTVTPTNTVTPSVTAEVTPTVTPTSTVTPSVTAEVTPTVTPTNTVTPSVTAEVTPTQTPTQTVTPSSTPPQVFALYFNQNQGGGAEGPGDLCQDVSVVAFTSDFNGVVNANVADTIFIDSGKTILFNGGNLIYDAGDILGSNAITKFRISSLGVIDEIFECPIPPSPTPTQTPTSTVTPTVTTTPTSTPTPTVTPSEAGLPPAYLLIEPTSDATNIGTFMFNAGATWYGFTNGSGPLDDFDVLTYMNYFQQNEGTGNVPSIVSVAIPQSNGGTDAEGNAIEQYKFTTVEIPSGTVNGNAWYTWLVPTNSIGGIPSGNRQTQIEASYGNGPQGLTAYDMAGTYYGYPVVNPTGYAPGTYRLYTTYSTQTFRLNNTSTTIYFKGGLVS